MAKWRNIKIGKVQARSQMREIKKCVTNLVEKQVLSRQSLTILDEINGVFEKFRLEKT